MGRRCVNIFGALLNMYRVPRQLVSALTQPCIINGDYHFDPGEMRITGGARVSRPSCFKKSMKSLKAIY